MENPNPIFDESKLANFRAIEQKSGKPLIAKLAVSFLAELAEKMDAINSQYQLKTWPELSRAAHTLKSASIYLGAVRMSDICSQIEKLTFNKKEFDESVLERLMKELNEVLEPTRLAVEKLR